MQENSNSQALMNLMVERIAASSQQRITFADYMNLVLYHPQYGYYASGAAKIGYQGDFFTSPSLGPDFGELLAEQFVEMWDVLGQPKPFILLEIGAGSGILAKDILQYIKNNYSDFFKNLQYLIVEESQGLKNRQKKNLRSLTSHQHKIKWKSWAQIPKNSIIGCVFSNELIDAFPVHQIITDRGNLKEVFVAFKDGKLVEKTGKISTPKIKEYFELIGLEFPSTLYPDGYRTEVNLAALDWLERIAQKLKKGYLLTIDYGYPAQKYYHPQRHQGTLKCYYQHRHHDNPYLNLGCQDITTHVNFTALERQGESQKLATLGLTRQGMFLMALGLGDRLSELASGQYSLPKVLQRRDALHQLIDPSGLGGFSVLIQAKGLSDRERGRSLKGLRFQHKLSP